jgi:hypothetical protein
MELKKLTLTNVRNFDIETFEFEGNKEIPMPNKGGKTTLADAISFLLIGKLYSGSSDIASLKPVKDTSLEVIVEALFIDDSNNELELKKVYKENWVKSRGSIEEELKGHTTTCYLNEKKLTVTNYEKELCDFFNVPSTKELNIMLNPYYFSQVLSWQERLEYVQQVTGKVTVDDVVDAAPNTKEIESDLKKYDIETLGKKYKNNIKEKKEAVRDLKIQIKGDQVDIVVSKKEYELAQVDYETNLEAITNKRVEMQGIKNPTLESLKEQREKQKELIEKSKEADREELSKKNAKINAEIDEIRVARDNAQKQKNVVENEIRGMEQDIDAHNKTIKNNERSISMKSVEKKNLLDQYHELNKKVYEPIESHECPNCGFDLSAESNKEKEEHFNQDKANKLKSLASNGKQLKLEIENLEKENNDLKEEIKLIEETIEAKKEELNGIEINIEGHKLDIRELENSKIYSYTSDATKDLKVKLDAIEENIEKERNKAMDDGGLQKEIDELIERNKELKETINKYDAQQVLFKRKTDREIKLMDLSSQLSDAEYFEDLLKLYTKTYLEILNARLAQHFPGISFMMVEENIKADSWNQTCYVMVEAEQGLVPYETANTESKIKIGVKLSNLLSEAFNWSKSPMVIDNAEAVTRNNREFETDAQVITLVADDLQFAEEIKNERVSGQQALEI